MIGYIKTDDMPDTINYRVDSLRGSYYDEKGIQDFAGAQRSPVEKAIDIFLWIIVDEKGVAWKDPEHKNA
jgi:hypothetical protein